MTDGCDCNCQDTIEDLQQQVDLLQRTVFDLEDLVTGEYSLGLLLGEDRQGIIERVQKLENGELDTGELVEANGTAELPIQQLTAARKAGHIDEESEKNRYRATFVWSEFYERAIQEPGIYKLTSQQVRNILDAHEFPTNRNTVRRVMEFAAKDSNPDATVQDPQADGNVIQMKRRHNKNVLIAKREEYEALAEPDEDEVDERLDQLAAADGGTDD